MTPSKKVITPTGSAAGAVTWLDLYPPAKSVQSPPPLPPRPDPVLISRLYKLRTLLDELRQSVENRELLIDCARKDPEYCIKFARNAKWKKRALYQNHLFYGLEEQVSQADNQITKQEIREWEGIAEKLRIKTLNESEQWDEEDRWKYMEEDPKQVFRAWNWDAAQQDRRMEDAGEDMEPVDPKDASKPNLKKDAGKYVDQYNKKFKGWRN